MAEVLTVVIPAFNEADAIAAVIDGVHQVVPHATIIVVDDGSTDATAAVAATKGAQVLRLPFNCGIGAAVRAGFRLASSLGADIVARLDGDGQHDPRCIPSLLAPVRADEADLAVGSRFLATGSFRPSAARRAGIRWFSWLITLAVGRRFTDPTSGFFAANRRALSFLGRETPSDYPEVEALVRLARAGYRVCEVPVMMHHRESGQSSIGGIGPLRYMVKVTLAIVAARIEARSRQAATG